MKFLFGDMIVEAVQTFKPIAAQVDMKLGGTLYGVHLAMNPMVFAC